MYTVLIADDERIERQGVRKLIEGTDRECRILEAANGKEAAELLDTEPVDILLTDIHMPHMSGLDLAARAARNGQIQTIVFSGYQDFNYARTAIEYGVRDYLLKPVDPEEFRIAYWKACRKVREKQKQCSAREQVSMVLSQYFLSRYIMEDREAVLEEAAEYVDLRSWDRICRIYLVESRDQFFENWEESFRQLVAEYLTQPVSYLNLNGGQALLLFLEDPESPAAEAERLADRLTEAFFQEFYIAVSGSVTSCRELPGVYQKLDELAEERFYQTGRRVFCETPEDPGRRVIQEGQLLVMLEKDIRNRDIYHLEDHFRKVIRKYSESGHFPTLYIKFVFSNIIRTLCESSLGIQTSSLESLVDQIYGCTSIADVVTITENQVEQYMRRIARDSGSLRFKIEQTRDYIHHHYQEDINLEALAKRLYISPGYLSMTFKRETGINLNQYIKNVRLEKSIELLEQTDMAIQDISRHTGFKNMSYYCKCFRQQYGVTPDTYKKRQAEA